MGIIGESGLDGNHWRVRYGWTSLECQFLLGITGESGLNGHHWRVRSEWASLESQV